MDIVCIGGGPAGLYFALLMKQQDPRHRVRVVERNRAYDTFGWGVVFSDQTLGNMQLADPKSAAEVLGAFNHWDDIEVHIRGHRVRSGGHGFCGIGRKRLLNILQRRCEEVGVELVFETDVADDSQYPEADLIIACDGLNSRIRTRHAEHYQPDIDVRHCRFVWLGTHKLFEAFTFAFEQTEHGWFQAHAYRFDDETSTFIVETPEDVWLKAGLDTMEKEEAIAFCEKLFAKYLDGHALMSNATPPARLGAVDQVSAHRVRPLGAPQRPRAGGADGRRGAHRAFLDRLRHQAGDRGCDRAGALHRAVARRPGRLHCSATRTCAASRCCGSRTRRATRPNGSSMSTAMSNLPPQQFAYSLLTRSQRISHENLRLRDKHYVEQFEDWIAGPGRRAAQRQSRSGAADVHAVHGASA